VSWEREKEVGEDFFIGSGQLGLRGQLRSIRRGAKTTGISSALRDWQTEKKRRIPRVEDKTRERRGTEAANNSLEKDKNDFRN